MGQISPTRVRPVPQVRPAVSTADAAIPTAPPIPPDQKLARWALALSCALNLIVLIILFAGTIDTRARALARVPIIIDTSIPVPIGFEEQRGLDRSDEEMKLTVDQISDIAGGNPLTDPLNTADLTKGLAGLTPTQVDIRAAGGNNAQGLDLATAGNIGVVNFMGAQAKGKSFAFLIDRSGSMEENNAWGFAVDELTKSLKQLAPNMEFQVVFYNHEWKMLDLPGKDTLTKATQLNVDRAIRQIKELRPEGGTDHGPALLQAIRRLKPDVIFLMTDAEAADTDTRMIGNITAENRRLAKSGNAAQINVIQFRHDWRRQTADIETLATQNNGTYRVVDAKAGDASEDRFRP